MNTTNTTPPRQKISTTLPAPHSLEGGGIINMTSPITLPSLPPSLPTVVPKSNSIQTGNPIDVVNTFLSKEMTKLANKFYNDMDNNMNSIKNKKKEKKDDMKLFTSRFKSKTYMLHALIAGEEFEIKYHLNSSFATFRDPGNKNGIIEHNMWEFLKRPETYMFVEKMICEGSQGFDTFGGKLRTHLDFANKYKSSKKEAEKMKKRLDDYKTEFKKKHSCDPTTQETEKFKKSITVVKLFENETSGDVTDLKSAIATENAYIIYKHIIELLKNEDGKGREVTGAIDVTEFLNKLAGEVDLKNAEHVGVLGFAMLILQIFITTPIQTDLTNNDGEKQKDPDLFPQMNLDPGEVYSKVTIDPDEDKICLSDSSYFYMFHCEKLSNTPDTLCHPSGLRNYVYSKDKAVDAIVMASLRICIVPRMDFLLSTPERLNGTPKYKVSSKNGNGHRFILKAVAFGYVNDIKHSSHGLTPTSPPNMKQWSTYDFSLLRIARDTDDKFIKLIFDCNSRMEKLIGPGELFKIKIKSSVGTAQWNMYEPIPFDGVWCGAGEQFNVLKNRNSISKNPDFKSHHYIRIEKKNVKTQMKRPNGLGDVLKIHGPYPETQDSHSYKEEEYEIARDEQDYNFNCRQTDQKLTILSMVGNRAMDDIIKLEYNTTALDIMSFEMSLSQNKLHLKFKKGSEKYKCNPEKIMITGGMSYFKEHMNCGLIAHSIPRIVSLCGGPLAIGTLMESPHVEEFKSYPFMGIDFNLWKIEYGSNNMVESANGLNIKTWETCTYLHSFFLIKLIGAYNSKSADGGKNSILFFLKDNMSLLEKLPGFTKIDGSLLVPDPYDLNPDEPSNSDEPSNPAEITKLELLEKKRKIDAVSEIDAASEEEVSNKRKIEEGDTRQFKKVATSDLDEEEEEFWKAMGQTCEALSHDFKIKPFAPSW